MSDQVLQGVCYKIEVCVWRVFLGNALESSTAVEKKESVLDRREVWAMMQSQYNF